jgi:hypothetical protein
MSAATPEVDTELLGPKRERLTVLDFLAVFTVSVSFGLSVASLFVPWGSTTGNQALSSSPDSWLVVLPYCIVLGAAAVMVWSRKMRSTVFILCALVAALWVSYIISDVVWTIQHQASLGLGAKLALGSLAAGCIALPQLRRPSLAVTPSGLIWGGVLLLCAGSWVLGFFGTWTRTTLSASAPGFHFNATHTAEFVYSCCFSFGSNYSNPEKIGSAILIAVILVAAVVLALCSPGWVSGTSVIALGLLYVGQSLSWIYDLAHNHPDPITLGLNRAEVAQGHITATVTGTWSGWVASAAAAALVVLGVFRLLASFARTSTGGARDALQTV